MTVTWLRIPPEAQVDVRSTWTLAVDPNQHLLGRSVILLNRPCERVVDLTAGEWMDLHTNLQRLQRALDAVLAPDKYDLGFLKNDSHQVYLQVVPRYLSTRTWRGERFDDPRWGEAFAATERSLDADALEALRDAIRSKLPAV